MLGGKRLEVLKEAVPRLSRVAVLYGSGLPGTSGEVKEHLPIAARSLGLAMRTSELRTVDDSDRAFAALNKERPDGIYAPGGGSLMRLNTKRVTDFALKARLPSMYSRKEAVDAGGLMSYATHRADTYRRIAYYVDKILRGAKPADVPVEQPTKFELVINLKTAKQIGLTIPQSVLYRADKVIK
jgi:putative ABC transport system substrate-binding protein